ncbi:Ig-like domain-containing protein [Auraticoccus monumenti]|uniref:Fibronectin type III domain-containing protein n=1 Tax=Auraticoccus monumenti TaxID=675864 RepID=A0A1G6VRF3_9ACTN|nr:Ig-like domain-containing protein [Auraticoccus monumenti]SDD55567.1 Fibronectin type III domain-containing protein [Auraticoccus monumenti]
MAAPRTDARLRRLLPGHTVRRFLRRSWSAALVGVLAVALVVGAAVARGYPAADLRLNDGSVWVVNQTLRLAGKLNKQIDELETSTQMINRDFDLWQDEGTILTRDNVTSQLAQVEPTSSALGTPVALPAGAVVSVNEARVAVVDPPSGRAWSRPVADVFGLDFVKAKADLDLGPGGTAVVTTDGDTIGLSAVRGELVRVPAEGLAEGEEPELVPLPAPLAQPLDVELTAVADRAVVLDRTAGTVWVEGSDPVAVPAVAGARLQAASAAGTRTSEDAVDVVLATAEGLQGVADDRLVPLAPGAAGTPVQPVVVAGCAYGAFTSGERARVGYACDRTAPVVTDVAEWAGGELSWRVNREVVVLNDELDGNIWLPTENMQLIKGWEKVTPPEPDEGDESENEDVVEKVSPERTGPNRKPTAIDDALAVRAGRSTLIPIIENDSDPDGDILTVQGPPEVSGGAGLQLVRGGTAVQVTVPEDAPSRLAFSYTVSDGRGGKDSARVSLDVRSAEQEESNEAPVAKADVEPLTVTLGGEASRRVLLDWRDPEGDDLILVDAKAPGDDEVTFTADGQLTFLDVGKDEGRKEVEITVSDGLDEATGTLLVDARDSGDVPPQANGDYVSVAAGEVLLVEPMANDTGEDISLATVETQIEGARIAVDYPKGTFTFRSDAPGTYYVGYIVTNRKTSFGVVRVDVLEPGGGSPPVATRDVALLPAGGSVLVDPLANDEDADDDVLVIQSVGQHPALRTKLINRQMLEVTAVTTPDQSISVPYTVSDGDHSVEGTLVVVPTEAPPSSRPVATPDTLTVRAGDVGSVRALGNDTSPAGLELTIDPELPEVSGGQAWVSGEHVRFAAPTVAGEYRVVYEIEDSAGQTASASIRIDVIADEVENTPPEPEVVTGRVLAGATGRLLIPLDDIDPEGDSVRLLGVDSGPTKGRLVAVDESWLEYEAYPEATGTDSFSYAVTDARGARAVGEIRVGVVPRSARNTPPLPIQDEVTAKPGDTVRVAVLANDSDPDGDAFGFAEDPLRFDTEASVVDDTVQFVAPEQPGTTAGQYTVADTRGAEGVGDVVITVDGDAPDMVPVVRDDIVSPADVVTEEEIDVPVLRNDFDPDGPTSQLTVSVAEDESVPEEERAVVAGQNVQVHIGAQMRRIRYQVTDGDGQVASAVITVPGRADAVPALRADVTAQEVVAGEPLALDINDFVLGTQGRQVQLTSEERIWASNGVPAALDEGSVQFTAPVEHEGPAAIIFEVTDGEDSTDPDGRTAVLTVPITVLAAPEPVAPDTPEEEEPEEVNADPEVVPVTLNVGAGEDVETIDLARSATDPDGDPLQFGDLAGDRPEGLTLEQSGARVSATAALDVASGTTARFTVAVTDGQGGEATLELDVVVQASSEPPPKAVDDAVPDAVQGETSQVPVLDNDANPFPDEPLTVVSATIESGSGTVEISGGQVAVTPAESFVGSMVVRYVVEDATRSTERRSEARIRLTVRGVPGKPGVPRIDEVGDRQARITFTAPADNGESISGYTVTGTGQDGQSVEQGCPSTTCTITGLTNDVRYTLSVVATNSIGDSEPSGTSAEIRPDVRPGKPGTPQVKFGDEQLALTWTAAPTKGSAVQSYTVELTGPSGRQQREVAGGQTSYTWTGLQNGSSYRFRVQASNKAPEPSDWSGQSKAEVPAGKPAPAQAVSAQDAGGNLGKKIRVSWQPSADPNGDAVSAYTVYANGSTVASVGGGVTSTDVDLSNGTEYTFTVSATNKAGEGRQSAASPAITPYGAPDAPATPQLSEGDQAVGLSWQPGGSNGAAVDSNQVRFNNGGSGALSGNPQNFEAQNGTAYTAQVRSCSQGKCSDWSADSNTATPYGVPTVNVSASAKGDRAGQVAWDTGANGDPANLAVDVRVEGGSRSKQTSGSQNLSGLQYETRYTITVTATNRRGTTEKSASFRTNDRPPPPSLTVFSGEHSPQCENTGDDPNGPCKWIGAQLNNFEPGSTVTCIPTESGAFEPRDVRISSDGSYRFPGTAPFGSDNNLGFWGYSTKPAVKCGNTTGGGSGPWP